MGELGRGRGPVGMARLKVTCADRAPVPVSRLLRVMNLA